MKALVIEAEPCETVKKLAPSSYVGFRMLSCGKIEHLLIADNQVRRVRKGCENCVLGVLVRSGHLIGQPSITKSGKLRFIVADTVDTRRVIRKYGSQVVSSEQVDIRGISLTRKQREIVEMLASNENISSIARTMGISKAAAWKLVKKTLRKVARLHAG
ncbi:MAG: hypothetical protein F7C34_01775 [Desulfurococcales archaeon]|nr:hypothetical protein [Desulfurococcales archaeon]